MDLSAVSKICTIISLSLKSGKCSLCLQCDLSSFWLPDKFPQQNAERTGELDAKEKNGKKIDACVFVSFIEWSNIACEDTKSFLLKELSGSPLIYNSQMETLTSSLIYIVPSFSPQISCNRKIQFHELLHFFIILFFLRKSAWQNGECIKMDGIICAMQEC